MRSTKELVKQAIASTVQTVRTPDPAGRTVILCYHSIHPTKPFRSVTPAQFAEHLTWLKAETHVVGLERVRDAAAGGRPRVAITFDDGYEDNWTHAFPLLLEHGLPATFFLTVGLVDGDRAVVERFMSTLRRSPYEDIKPLTWEQVREMQSAGAAFGSHTYSHPNLARTGPADALRELVRSKEILEERLQRPVTSLAYPFGKPRWHVTPETVAATEEAGYSCAAAVLTRSVRSSDSNLFLPRVIVTADGLATLRQKVMGAWDFLGWWQERAPMWALRTLRPADARF